MTKEKQVKPVKKAGKTVAKKEVIKEELIQEEVIQEKVKEVKVESKNLELGNDDLVTVINNTAHDLIYVNAITGEQFTITGYGAEYEMSFKELKMMKNQQPAFIDKEWIIINNEQAVKQLGLVDYYKNKLMPKMVSNLLDNDFSKLKQILATATPQTKESFIKIITDRISKRQFNDLSKILDLQEILGVKLIG